MDAVAQLLHGVQGVGQGGGRNGGGHHVRGVHGVEDAHQDHAHQRGDHGHQPGYDGVYDAHDHQGAHAPQQAEFQADVAPDVEGVVTVVPPAGAVQLVQGPAAHQLQDTGQDDTAQIEQQGVVHQRGQSIEHDDHAEAVDGAHRPVQEAAVHQLAGGHSGVDHFQAPAQTGIDQKIGQRLVQRKAADGGLGEEGYHKNTSGQFCFATILYSSPGSKKGQAAVRQER